MWVRLSEQNKDIRKRSERYGVTQQDGRSFQAHGRYAGGLSYNFGNSLPTPRGSRQQLLLQCFWCSSNHGHPRQQHCQHLAKDVESVGSLVISHASVEVKQDIWNNLAFLWKDLTWIDLTMD